MYLVYIRGLKGPCPQLWHEDQTTGVNGFQHKPVGAEGSDLLYFRQLTAEEKGLSLDELARKYPFIENTVVVDESAKTHTVQSPSN
jgi:hypothetical protein